MVAPPSPLLLALAANKKSEMANSFWANWNSQQKSNIVQYNPILALIRPNSLFGLLRPGFLDLSTLLMLQNLVNNNRQVNKN